MSCMFFFMPELYIEWSNLHRNAQAAGASLGYKETETEQVVPRGNRSVTVPIEDSNILGDTMARDSKFTINKDDISATFNREADGRVSVHVSGKNHTDSELQTLGKELIGKITQQYAYNKVVTEMKKKGFTVTSEEVANDQTIRIHVSKYV